MTNIIDNQFSRTNPYKGEVIKRGEQVFPAVLNSSSSSATFEPGQAVVIVNDNNPELVVDVVTNIQTNNIFGFVHPTLQHGDTISRGAKVDILGRGSVIKVEANAAIAKGALLEYVISGNRVATVTDDSRVVGQALGSASAQGDLLDMLILVDNAGPVS